MNGKSMAKTAVKSNSKGNSVGESQKPLARELETQRTAFDAQPPMTQRFLEAQGRALAEALTQKSSQVRFMLPDRVMVGAKTVSIPSQMQEQMAGGLIGTLTGADIRAQVRERLSELEGSNDAGVAAAAGLLRYITAYHMIYNMLPAGRTVTYEAAAGEEIPTIPVGGESASALTADSDAIAEQGDEGGRGELIVPYVPYARRFYLPQWVAFDEDGKLIAKSTQEAEANLASMQNFLAVLHAAVSLAPYIVADEAYQSRRYGMLGQLINQGRALALHQTHEICNTIKKRAASNDLNRGLSLSLPYFDDQALAMKMHHFQVIPAGRIMFVPGFVVRAAQEEQVKVGQDTRLNASTRKSLLSELAMIEAAFDSSK
jgi:hypothetical protein